MKIVIKSIIGLGFLPFIALGFLIGIVKALFIITFGLAWDTGDAFCNKILIRIERLTSKL